MFVLESIKHEEDETGVMEVRGIGLKSLAKPQQFELVDGHEGDGAERHNHRFDAHAKKLRHTHTHTKNGLEVFRCVVSTGANAVCQEKAKVASTMGIIGTTTVETFECAQHHYVKITKPEMERNVIGVEVRIMREIV